MITTIASAIALLAASASSLAGDAKAPAHTIEKEGQATTSLEDFAPISGDGWQGALEYLNFGTDKRSTIPVRMIVKEPDGTSISYAFLYPGEEGKNASEVLAIASDGRAVSGYSLISRNVAPDGTITLVTEGKGNDDRRGVNVRFTYELSANRFVVRKDVEGDNGVYFNRNEYRLTR